MEPITTALLEHGITGIMLAFFIWYLVRRDTQHQDERKEWKGTMEGHVDKVIDCLDKNTAALNQLNVRVENAECKFGNNHK